MSKCGVRHGVASFWIARQIARMEAVTDFVTRVMVPVFSMLLGCLVGSGRMWWRVTTGCHVLVRLCSMFRFAVNIKYDVFR